MKRRRLIRPIQPPVTAFAGFRFPPEVILIAVRLVPTLRIVVPGPGRTARRARHRGRPRDLVPVGSTIHTCAYRRGPAVPSQRRRSTRPTSRSPARGGMSTGPLTNTARSLTCSCRIGVTSRLRQRSSPVRSAPTVSRLRSRPTGPTLWSELLRNSCRLHRTTGPSTQTIESKLITGGSRQDFDRCGASNGTGPPAL
jgi:hypothetical protein